MPTVTELRSVVLKNAAHEPAWPVKAPQTALVPVPVKPEPTVPVATKNSGSFEFRSLRWSCRGVRRELNSVVPAGHGWSAQAARSSATSRLARLCQPSTLRQVI